MTDLVLLNEKQEADFLARIAQYEHFALTHVINSIETYSEADRKITEGEHIKKRVCEKLDPIVAEKYKAHKESTKFRSGFIEPVEESSQVLIEKMKVFQRVQDEKYAKEKKRLEDEAKKRQEIECLKQAQQMEKAGESQAAIDAVLDLAEDPLPEVHMATPILRSKTKFIRSWDIEIINEDEVPEEYTIFTINKSAIKKIVNDKDGNIKIPGIRIFETTTARRNSR